MKSISQQTRSLIQKQQEFGLIDSRISQLKQQLQLQESNNHIIEFKVNKILETKQNTSKDQSDYSRRLENLNYEQQNRNSKIKLLKHLNEEDSFRRKRDLDEEKRLEQEVMKERSMLYQLQYKHSQNEELQLKQQQFQKIQEQKFRMKQKLDLKRIEKIENVRNCQIKKKAELSVKFDLQQQEYQLKIQEEQQLLKKVSFSQLKFQALKDDLDLAQKISIRDYANSATNQGFIKQPFDQTKIKKAILTSPYAQIPSILNQKDLDKLNLLSKLLKPSFKDQQQTTERLNQKTNQTHFHTQISDRTHTKGNSSKFDTETSQTLKNKFQSVQDQNAKLDTQGKGSLNCNDNLDSQKLLKSESKLPLQENHNEEEENKENQQKDNYEQEASYEDNYEDDNQPSQQDQDEQHDQDQEQQNQEQQNEEEFNDEEQYPADNDEEQ
ncbi:unnamed protein product (macronuclear) [Paramecium tetraurelia]|uniref:Uncharacterized protein n=1 Tax=Paramecium tetraurelia TaxID=5888 RepID=A0D4E6_PARTE|nr:uncharacterized protein GSPATT00013379001 [Paramecium tetraurelia]CAK77913.1 unnamed protein product [Paramecium tetraurelia]|eukprot:XP_001445310.1 hypothetical protein (macronuclear) [Paramecium tetraurelia strain d4-2]